MANELIVIKNLSDVGHNIMSMLSLARNAKKLRRQDVIVFEEKMQLLKDECKARGIAELTRVCIAEMDKTFQDIKQRNYQGEMLEMSLGLLGLQYQHLQRIIASHNSR